MEGINWLDLFTATDRFLSAIVERNVMLVYVVLFSIFFSETGLVFMAFLPGDSLLFVAGAVSALPAVEFKGLNVHLLVVIIAVAAVLGNTLNYFIGAWLGKKVYDGTIGWIDQQALMKTHAFFERHGGKTVMISRFVPVVRSFAPLVAGASGMDFHRFQFFNVRRRRRVGRLAGLWRLSVRQHTACSRQPRHHPRRRHRRRRGAADARGLAKASAPHAETRVQVIRSKDLEPAGDSSRSTA